MNIEALLSLKYLFTFSALILPGFIIIKIIRLQIASKDFLLKDMLFEALSYSIFNITLVGWIPYLLFIHKYYTLSFIVFLMTLLITPILIALLFVKIMDAKFFTKYFNIQIPTAWDWFFSQRES